MKKARDIKAELDALSYSVSVSSTGVSQLVDEPLLKANKDELHRLAVRLTGISAALDRISMLTKGKA